MKKVIKWYNRFKFINKILSKKIPYFIIYLYIKDFRKIDEIYWINKIYLIPKEIISCINKYNYLCYKKNIDSCIYEKDEFIIIARKPLIDTNICTKRNKKYSTLEV